MQHAQGLQQHAQGVQHGYGQQPQPGQAGFTQQQQQQWQQAQQQAAAALAYQAGGYR
jgi:hypothetical protein